MNIAHKPPDNTKPKPGYDEAGDKCKEDITPLHVHHCSKYILHKPSVLVAHPVQLGVTVSRFRDYPSSLLLCVTVSRFRDNPSSLLPAQILRTLHYLQI